MTVGLQAKHTRQGECQVKKLRRVCLATDRHRLGQAAEVQTQIEKPRGDQETNAKHGRAARIFASEATSDVRDGSGQPTLLEPQAPAKKCDLLDRRRSAISRWLVHTMRLRTRNAALPHRPAARSQPEVDPAETGKKAQQALSVQPDGAEPRAPLRNRATMQDSLA
jgi:hypothetical protein